MPGVRLAYGKNLRSLTREIDGRPLVTRVYPRGAQLDGFYWTMANNRWQVGEITSGTAVITLVADKTGEPIRWDDQLNGLYAEKTGSTAHWQILDSEADGQVLTLEDVPDELEEGDYVTIREAPVCPGLPPRELLFLDRPDARTTYGQWVEVVDIPNVPPIDNLMPNAFFEDWTGSGDTLRPEYWNLDSVSSFSQSSSRQYAWYGEYAARLFVTVAGPATVKWGTYSDWIAFRPTAELPYLSLQSAFTITTGVLNMYLEVDTVGDATNVITIPDQTGTHATSAKLNRREPSLGIVDQYANFWERGGKRFRVVVEAENEGDELLAVFLDAVQVIQASAPAESFYDRVASNTLWHLANDYLEEFGTPLKKYVPVPRDLYRANPDSFPYETLRHGANVVVRDYPLSVEDSVRVSDIRRDLTAGALTTIELSTQRNDFTRIVGLLTPPRTIVPTPRDEDLLASGTDDGHLSGLTVELQTDGATTYELVTWDHNTYLQDNAGSFTVDIRSTVGGSLTTGRDPTLEYTGTDDTPRRGGYRTAVSRSTVGVGTYHVNVYTVDLKKSGTLIASYYTSIAAYYA